MATGFSLKRLVVIGQGFEENYSETYLRR